MFIHISFMTVLGNASDPPSFYPLLDINLSSITKKQKHDMTYRGKRRRHFVKIPSSFPFPTTKSMVPFHYHFNTYNFFLFFPPVLLSIFEAQ
jgi:hypothetical protein